MTQQPGNQATHLPTDLTSQPSEAQQMPNGEIPVSAGGREPGEQPTKNFEAPGTATETVPGMDQAQLNTGQQVHNA